jgi:AcrR family transcriptional regulator
MLSQTDQILEAARRCTARWGRERVTIDDIAEEAKISRATLYRLFPGGKQVLYEAMREQGISTFLAELDSHLAYAETLEDLVVSILTEATRLLKADEQLQVMLASQPGDVLTSLGFEDLPRTFAAATVVLTPRVAPFIGEERSAELAEWLSRVVLSFFFVPSVFTDLSDPMSARRFAHTFVLPAFIPEHSAL